MAFFLLEGCFELSALLDFPAESMAHRGGRCGGVERVAIFLLPLPHECEQSLRVHTFAI
jgi:hypothetical protein